jgi:hypothetical protein
LPWLEGFAALPFLDLDMLEPVVIVDEPAPDRRAVAFLQMEPAQTAAVNPSTCTNKKDGMGPATLPKRLLRKQSQLPMKIMGENSWTKRDRTTGKFMDQKKAPASKKFKDVCREKVSGDGFDFKARSNDGAH